MKQTGYMLYGFGIVIAICGILNGVDIISLAGGFLIGSGSYILGKEKQGVISDGYSK